LGNAIKYSVVIPEVRDTKDSHPKLLSNKLVYISYGPLALGFSARVEFEDSGYELVKGIGDVKLWDGVRGHLSISLLPLSSPTLHLFICIHPPHLCAIFKDHT
jgi:hypothetical protein